jgi:hypothetical protein
MIHFAGLPLKLWAEACNTAVYLMNRVATKSIIGKTPYEIWKGVKPNLSHIRVFGSTAYVHVLKEKRNKLEPKSIKCCHVGYCELKKGFRAWDQGTGKVLISRDVIFQELEKGMSAGPPCGISDLIADIFDQQTQPNDRQPLSNLLSSTKTNRIFDLVPVVYMMKMRLAQSLVVNQQLILSSCLSK